MLYCKRSIGENGHGWNDAEGCPPKEEVDTTGRCPGPGRDPGVFVHAGEGASCSFRSTGAESPEGAEAPSHSSAFATRGKDDESQFTQTRFQCGIGSAGLPRIFLSSGTE